MKPLLHVSLFVLSALSLSACSLQSRQSQPSMPLDATTSEGPGSCASYDFVGVDQYARQGATIEQQDSIHLLNLGTDEGYFDLTPETGRLIQSLQDFTISTYFNVSSANPLDGYGHFLFAFSALAENGQDEGPYMAFRLNEQRFETSTGGWAHEQAVMQGGQAKRDVWVHVLFRQQGHHGELWIDGELIGTNEQMPILSEVFPQAPAHCWIGKAPFKGDKYLTHTRVSDLRIFNYSVSDDELKTLAQGRQMLK